MCARFPDFVKNFSERQILWSLCSVDFHTLTLQLPIQTPHFVAPELQVFVSLLENRQNFSNFVSMGKFIYISYTFTGETVNCCQHVSDFNLHEHAISR